MHLDIELRAIRNVMHFFQMSITDADIHISLMTHRAGGTVAHVLGFDVMSQYCSTSVASATLPTNGPYTRFQGSS